MGSLVREVRQGEIQRGDWFHHVVSWWEHRDSENILFLKYEDLKKDTFSVMKRIAEFLGDRGVFGENP